MTGFQTQLVKLSRNAKDKTQNTNTMKESSNNLVTLVIIAIALSAVFAVLHFSDSSTNSTQFLLSTKDGSTKSIHINTSGDDMYSNNLSGYKSRQAAIGVNGASGIAIPGSVTSPSASIAETDVQNTPQQHVSKSSTSAFAVTVLNPTSSKIFKTSNVDNSALQQNIPKGDISATLKSRTAEVSNTSTKAKVKTTSISDKKGPQKDKPNGPGANLPVGEGWIMLLMLAGYGCVLRFRVVGS